VTSIGSNLQALTNDLSFSTPAAETQMALIEAEGTLMLNAGSGTSTIVELRLVVDNNPIEAIRTEVANYIAGNMSNAWHLHALQPLPGGTHEAHVDAHVIAGTTSVQVNNTNPGRLTMLLFKVGN
jgi:hypothetical protein